MPEFNLGNIVGILHGQTAPSKKDVLWGQILNPSFPDIVDIHYWDETTGAWVPIYDPTTQYWLRPVLSILATPPGTPQEGDRYLIADAGATGVWSGKEDQVAHFKTGAWQYQIPLDGFIISVRDQVNTLYDYRGVYSSGGTWNENDFSVPVAPGDYIQSTEKGASNGVATLDSSGKIPQNQIDDVNLIFQPATPSSWGAISTIKDALDYLRELITGAVEGITASDIDTVAKIEALLTDGNTLITDQELTTALEDVLVSGGNGDKSLGLAPGNSTYDLFDGLFRIQHLPDTILELSGGDFFIRSDEGAERKKIVIDTVTQSVSLEIRNKTTDALIQSLVLDLNGVRRGVAATGAGALEILDRGTILQEFTPWITDSRADEELGWEIGPVGTEWTGRLELQLNWLILSMFQSGVGRLFEVKGSSTEAHLKSVHIISIKDNTDALAPLQLGDPTDDTHAASQGWVNTQLAGIASGTELTPVQDEAALVAIDTTDAGDYPDKIQILVENLGKYRFDRDSVEAADSPRVIAPTTGPGRWYKYANILANHNLTEGKQGGTTNEYYHLTSALHTEVQTIANSDRRPLNTEIDITVSSTLDCSLGQTLYDDDVVTNEEIDTISNLTRTTKVHITGGGTLTFSTAILTDNDNQIEGETDTVNPFITITPKPGGGVIIIYVNSAIIKELPFTLSDVTSNIVPSTTVRANFWRPRVNIEIISIESVLAGAAVGTVLHTVDVHKAGTTIFDTKITHDSTEPSSLDATTPYAFTAGANLVNAGQLVELFVDLTGDTTPGIGNQLWIKYKEV